MDWLVKNAQSRDVERQHLNKILQEIRNTLNELEARVARSTSEEQRIRDVVIKMVTTGNQSGINVTYNTTSKAIDFAVRTFTIQLTGAVTGTGTVTGLGNVSISTTLSQEVDGVEEAPLDGLSYWRNMGTWVTVPFPLETLQYLTPGGILVLDGDLNWYARTIEGTTGEIDVADGDGIAGNPVLSLPDITDSGTGDATVKLYSFDTKGRKTGSENATTDDLPEGSTNLYFPEAPVDGNQYARKDAAWELVAATGGVETVVEGTGIDVDDTDPANPIVALDATSIASLALADSALQPGDSIPWTDLTSIPAIIAALAALANAAGVLTNDGTGVLSWGAGGGASTVSIQASENLAAGDFVTIHNSGGSRVRRADRTIASGDGAAQGFVTAAVTSGALADVHLSGPNDQLSGLTPGDLYVLDITGDIVEISTLTPVSGQILQVLGTAIDATTLAVNIEQAILRE